MRQRVAEFAKSRAFKALCFLVLVTILLFIIPIPPVGVAVEELALPGSRFVIVYGMKMHYVEVGEGDLLIVLLHGFGASVFSWREVISELSTFGRVVAFDRPGFGLTERVEPWKTPVNPYHVDGAINITCEFIKRIAAGEKKVVLVGHSAGAGVALLVATRCDLPISALVLEAPSWKPYSRQLHEKLLFELPLADKYGPLIVRLMIGQLEGVLYRAWYNKSKLTEDVIEGYKYPLKARDWDKGLYWLLKYREFPSILGELEKLKQPILIIHGDRDEIIPINHSIELYQLLKERTHVELVVVSECGHIPHEESPGEFVLALSRFIRDYVLRV